MKEQIKQKGGMKIIVLIVGVIVVGVWLAYGTLNPCGMLKKEILNEAKTSEEKGLVLLFGGLIDSAIYRLNPVQCISGVVKMKFGNSKEVEDELFGK